MNINKVFIIDSWMHFKNKIGLESVLNYLNIPVKYGNIEDLTDEYNIIYSPCVPLNILELKDYKKKLWLFGPHFSVFPDEKLELINYNMQNIYYLLPSLWCKNLWLKHFNNININIIVNPFALNLENYKIDLNIERKNIIIYFKSRKLTELDWIINLLNKRNIKNFVIFNYNYSYEEHVFLDYLKTCKYGILIDIHESQGFAVEEMLAMNIPLLVWNVKNMSQEEGQNYLNEYEATSVPYWDERCGEIFYDKSEYENTFDLFISKLDTYKPREYVTENLSIEACANKFKKRFLDNLKYIIQ